MAENPLLPHKKLKEMYLRMLHCRELDRGQKVAREALLAATTMHLQPGDLVCAAPGDATLATLAPANRAGVAEAGLVTPGNVAYAGRLPTAASMARGQLAASPADQLALTLAFSTVREPEPGWQHALTVAQQVPLPLILVVADMSGARASSSRTALNWSNVSALARRIKLPVLSVDGEDAVAVYRVMQESAIRARYGGGPAVIWARMSGSKTDLPRSQQPLQRLERYLKVRNIPLPKRR